MTASGLIRIIDMQFVMKGEDGDLLALESSDLTEDRAIGVRRGHRQPHRSGPKRTTDGAEAAVAGALAAADRAFGMTAADIAAIAADLEPGTAMGMRAL
ncbi:MAG: hypothetical protein R3A10_01325 [Caldilineaceae bacterium]